MSVIPTVLDETLQKLKDQMDIENGYLSVMAIASRQYGFKNITELANYVRTHSLSDIQSKVNLGDSFDILWTDNYASPPTSVTITYTVVDIKNVKKSNGDVVPGVILFPNRSLRGTVAYVQNTFLLTNLPALSNGDVIQFKYHTKVDDPTNTSVRYITVNANKSAGGALSIRNHAPFLGKMDFYTTENDTSYNTSFNIVNGTHASPTYEYDVYLNESHDVGGVHVNSFIDGNVRVTWADNLYREFFNSSCTDGSWLNRKGFDIGYTTTYKNTRKYGFMYGFPSDFLAALGEIEVEENVLGGVYRKSNNYFFPPSNTNLYYEPANNKEGTAWQYFVEGSGSASPLALGTASEIVFAPAVADRIPVEFSSGDYGVVTRSWSGTPSGSPKPYNINISNEYSHGGISAASSYNLVNTTVSLHPCCCIC